MQTVWKFTMNVIDAVSLDIPGGNAAKFLHAAPAQGSAEIDTWWMVDDESPPSEVPLWITGTGRPVPETARHVVHAATVIHTRWSDGIELSHPLVWHLWLEPWVVGPARV